MNNQPEIVKLIDTTLCTACRGCQAGTVHSIPLSCRTIREDDQTAGSVGGEDGDGELDSFCQVSVFCIRD